VSWQNGKQGIVEFYGEDSIEIKEFPKNIYHLNGLCFGDTKDKLCICYDNCCANQHSFKKYSYSIKNKHGFKNRLIFVFITVIY